MDYKPAQPNSFLATLEFHIVRECKEDLKDADMFALKTFIDARLSNIAIELLEMLKEKKKFPDSK